MEAKATRFLSQFSRAVFLQWTQTAERQQFWKDGDFLHGLLEEAVAKLPQGKLKAHLTRNLRPLEVQLASLLRELHVSYVQEQQEEAKAAGSSLSHGALLNEELTELELLQAAAAPTSDRQHQLAGVLALDAGIDIEPHPADEPEDDVKQLVEKFALIAARNYESPREQAHKRGLVLQKLAVRVQQQVEALCSSNWECSEDSDAGKQVLQLRALLERVVVQDAVELARLEQEGDAMAAPWTSFFRPEESKQLRKTNFDGEVAKIYGALLALAIYFPIESSDEESDEEASGDSSSDEDEEKASTTAPKKQQRLSAVAQAQLTTRQALFAAQLRQNKADESGQWLVSVLSFLQSLPKPVTYLDEEKDEVLDAQDRRALLDCLGQVYARAFASVALFDQTNEALKAKKAAVQDRALFQAIMCLRDAAHFMRVERKSSIPAVTTAMAHLAGVPVPATFITWLDVEQTATPSTVLEKAVQRLWKQCESQTKMANILLSSTHVTDDELPLIQKSYLTYLQHVAEGTLAKARSPPTNATDSSAATEEAAAQESSLFFVDNAGGEAEEVTSKSKKKRSKKKRRANRNKSAVDLEEAAASKRSRISA